MPALPQTNRTGVTPCCLHVSVSPPKGWYLQDHNRAAILVHQRVQGPWLGQIKNAFDHLDRSGVVGLGNERVGQGVDFDFDFDLEVDFDVDFDFGFDFG